MDPFILGHWFVGSAQLNKALIPTTWFGYMIFSHRIALKLKKDHNSTTFFCCFFLIGKAQFKYTCNVQENSKGKREIKGKGGKNTNKKTAQQSSLSSIGYPLTHLVKKEKKKSKWTARIWNRREHLWRRVCKSVSLSFLPGTSTSLSILLLLQTLESHIPSLAPHKLIMPH